MDIEKFRDRGYRVFVFIEAYSNKQVPEHVKEMESWLKERGVDVRIIRW